MVTLHTLETNPGGGRTFQLLFGLLLHSKKVFSRSFGEKLESRGRSNERRNKIISIEPSHFAPGHENAMDSFLVLEASLVVSAPY